MSDVQPPPPEIPAPEPGTGRALWPTFMRRTLPADEVAPEEDQAEEPASLRI